MSDILYGVLCSEGNIDRTLNVKRLKKQIPFLKIVFSNRENVFENHLKLFAWCANTDARGIVILEDDVQLCKDFVKKCENLISAHNGEVISMFESALSKSELHSEYRAGGRFNWCQCNYYPREVCSVLSNPQMLIDFKKYFYTKLHEPWNYPIDRYIAYVLGKNEINYWMEVPFLVQHLPLKSNFKGRPTNRQSRYFIDDYKKGQSFDT